MYIRNYTWTGENSSVSDLVDYMLKRDGLKREEKKPSEKQLREHPEKYPNGEFKETDLEKFPAGMSRTEWISFLISVKKNEKLMSLKIVEFDSQEGAWEYFSISLIDRVYIELECLKNKAHLVNICTIFIFVNLILEA